MNILIAPDKFKDALSAFEICQCLKKGILQTFPNANCTLLPLADGGEGTLESINAVLESNFITLKVLDPFLRTISASYLYIEEKQIAIIEMARASGIELVEPKSRNCLKTSSYGTGQLINHAFQRGAKQIILTVGGTATNDAGIGIASALGYKFLDENGRDLIPFGENLIKIKSIDSSKVSPDLLKVKFTIATDVTNPFHGYKGAAYVFARQKGADEQGIKILDTGLENFAEVLTNSFGINPQNLIGSGAGGGVAGGLTCILNAEIISAASWIIEINKIAEILTKTDILITGEGKIDSQTWDGKLISQLLKTAETSKVPVILICGTLQDIEFIAQQSGILYATSILKNPISLKEALLETAVSVENQGALLGLLLSKITLPIKF
jgi:glycerate kinase